MSVFDDFDDVRTPYPLESAIVLEVQGPFRLLGGRHRARAGGHWELWRAADQPVSGFADGKVQHWVKVNGCTQQSPRARLGVYEIVRCEHHAAGSLR